MPFKFGMLPAERSMKTLSLSNYMKASVVPFPPTCAWERPLLDYQMLGNDAVGDCTIAAVAHDLMVKASVAHAGDPPFSFTTDAVLKEYSAITGFDPVTGANDNGASLLVVLNRYASVGIFGQKLDGFVSLDVQNIDHVKAATYLFGGVYLGFNVPVSVLNNPANKSWRLVPGDKPSNEGHCVISCGYGRAGNRHISWGSADYTMSWDFWQQYVDEAYALVSKTWIRQSGLSPTGVDLNGLLLDLHNLEHA